jgi:hypothetical protein
VRAAGAEERRVGAGWGEAAAAACVYAVGFAVASWPLLRHPASTVLDTGSLYGPAAFLIQRDINLTMWTLAWVSHALVTRPLGLFDANAFHPATNTLALTEHMLGNAPFFSPVYWVTANPVLAHQVTLVASFVVAALAMAAFVLYWTRDRAAALAAGFFYAFAPYRFWQLGNLHVISIGWLPLVLLGIDLTVDRRRGRGGPLLVAAALVLSSLCSYYIGYAGFVVAALYAPLALWARGWAALRRLPALAAAAVGAAAVVGACTLPYLLLRDSGVLPDYTKPGRTSLAFLGMLKFGPLRLLSWYVRPRTDGIPQFLTWTAMALAGLALAVRRFRHPGGALVLVAAAGAVLSLGPNLIVPGLTAPLPYRLLMLVVPGFSSMRVPQRFGAVVTLAVMALAGLGLAAARARLARGRAGLLLAALAVAVMLFEATPRGLRGFPMPVGDGVPPAYRWLARHGGAGPLLELPADRQNLHRQSVYMYFSTVHWLPTVNGYSAYPPAPYLDVMRAAEQLPAPGALQAILARVPLRWVLVHRAAIPQGAWGAWDTTFRAALDPVRDFGTAVLFEVPPS